MQDNITVKDDITKPVEEVPVTISVPQTVFDGNLNQLKTLLEEKQRLLDLNKSNMERTVARIQIEIDHAQKDVDGVQSLIDSVNVKLADLPPREIPVVEPPIIDPVSDTNPVIG